MKTNPSMSMKVLQTMPHEAELLLFHFTCLIPTLFQTINKKLTAHSSSKNVLTCLGKEKIYKFIVSNKWKI